MELGIFCGVVVVLLVGCDLGFLGVVQGEDCVGSMVVAWLMWPEC